MRIVFTLVVCLLIFNLVSSQKLVAPTNFMGQAVSKNVVNFKWKDTSLGEQGYEIQQKRLLMGYKTITRVGPNIEEAKNVYCSARTSRQIDEFRIFSYAGRRKKSSSSYCKVTMMWPDLVVNNLSVSKGLINQGEEVNSYFSIKNIGTNKSPKFSVKLYLSKNSEITDFNKVKLLGQKEITGIDLGETSGNKSINFKIPSDTSVGEYYLVILITEHHPDDNTIVVLNELSRDNNSKAIKIKVQKAPPKPKCDLTLANIKFPTADNSGSTPKFQQSSNMEVRLVCKNIGEVSSPSTEVNFYLCKGTTPDLSDGVGSVAIGKLNSNAEKTLSHIISLTNSHYGSYNVIAYVDKAPGWKGSISEENEDNNSIVGKIYVEKLGSSSMKSLTLPKESEFSKKKEEVAIYPNPSCGYFNFTGIIEYEKIEVYDLTGKLLFSKNISGLEEVVVDISKFGRGHYIVNIVRAKEKVVRKLLVK